MFANRLSWTYDFRGPSKAVDTGELETLHCQLVNSYALWPSDELQY